jgi:hypothetical protein
VGLNSDGVINALESPDGHDLYLATYDGVVHLRRDPGGGLSQPVGGADCCRRIGRRCRRAAGIPSSTDDTTLALSADGRNLYETFAGHEFTGGGDVYTGAVLQFARDPATGALVQTPPPSGCVSGPLGSEAGCTAWSILAPLISGMTLRES